MGAWHMMQYGQVFVVYPSRNRLVQRILLPALAFAAVIAAAPTLVSTLLRTQQNAGLPAGSMVLVSLALLCTLFLFYRLLVPKPALIIDNEGIVDNASAIVAGVGMIHWSEIAAVLLYGNAQQSYLVIVPHDLQTLQARQNVVTRAFATIFTRTLPSPISIPEWLLTMPAAEVLAQIRARYDAQIRMHQIGVQIVD
jgi:hypothetical protein